jgi:hypothetical protein
VIMPPLTSAPSTCCSVAADNTLIAGLPQWAVQ